MESIRKTIIENNLISEGDRIGVALSGGSDSMALLHYLNSIKKELDFEIIAIHLDHSIREKSYEDTEFVEQYCSENNIRLMKTRVDVPSIAKEKGESLEQAARDARYKFFDAILAKDIVDKIALAHHASDQAETILMHILRGSGLSGAKGMEVRRGNYIRPMLNTEKSEIMSYINANYIEYVTDETNEDSNYNRNFLRNKVFPLLKQRYPNSINSLCAFGKSCKEDSEFISGQITMDAVLKEKTSVKIPLSYFLYENSIINRIIFKSLEMIGITTDIERKHIELIKDLAANAENGSRIDLPNYLTAHKEYEYITLLSKQTTINGGEKPLRCGKFYFPNYATMTVSKGTELDHVRCAHLFDCKKVPKDAVWRFRQEGDVFEKFGGGTKKLKTYLIDKKVPQRLRNNIPVLASGNNILVILGYEISNSIRVDEKTKQTYRIDLILD